MIVLSVAGAVALTLPYPGASAPLVVAVYQRTDRSEPGDATRVALAFEGIDAGRIRIALASRVPLGAVMLASNGITDCRPYVGTLQSFTPQPSKGGVAPRAVDSNGAPAGRVDVLEANIETVVSRQECTLTRSARRYDFETYGLDLLTGYRFLADASGTQFAPSDPRLRPVQDYTMRLDGAIEEARFDGGASVNDRPNSRELSAAASAVSVRWKDPHLANLREFSLFILAGLFALGISMLIELVKPHFLE